MLPLQPQRQRGSTKQCAHPQRTAETTVLLRWLGAARTVAVPASSAACGTVVVFFNVRLLVRVLVFTAEPEAGHDGVEEAARAAEDAQKEEQKEASEDTDDDAGNGTAGEAAAAASRDGGFGCGDTRGDWGDEGNSSRGSAGLRDNDVSRAGRTQRRNRSDSRGSDA